MVKRTKRFFAGDGVSDSDSNAGMKEARDAIDAETARTPSADYGDYIPQSSSETVKATAKPTPKAVSAPASEPSSVRKLSREEGEAIKKASEASKPAPAKTESAPASTKKDTYRDFSGNIQTKKSTADRDAESAARREKVMDTVKSIGSGIGSLFSKAKQNYESTRPVSKQVQKERAQAAARGNLAKGGKVSSASSRGDGIAQRGKTRGRMR